MLAGPEQSAVEGVGSEEISGAGRAVVKYKTLSASLINTHTSFASVPFTQKAYQTSWTPDLIPQLKGEKKKNPAADKRGCNICFPRAACCLSPALNANSNFTIQNPAGGLSPKMPAVSVAAAHN